jgi:hypothetical protein
MLLTNTGILCVNAVRVFIIAILSLFISVLAGQADIAADRLDHLFYIERNKNGNIVYYDVCHNGSSGLCKAQTVTAYWILENGKKEELSMMEQKYVYGITPEGKLQHDSFRFSVASLMHQQIAVEKINGRYRAVTSVNNSTIVLEKVYVNAKDSLFGLPRINYVEYIGWTREESAPVRIKVVIN